MTEKQRKVLATIMSFHAHRAAECEIAATHGTYGLARVLRGLMERGLVEREPGPINSKSIYRATAAAEEEMRDA